MRDCHCWQWVDFTMGPYEQNQHYAEYVYTHIQKVCLYTHTRAVVLLRGLPSLEAKNELFVGKKRKKQLANSSQTDYNGPRDNLDYQEMTIFFDAVVLEKNKHFHVFLCQICTTACMPCENFHSKMFFSSKFNTIY